MPNMLAVKPQTYSQIVKQSLTVYRLSFAHVYWVSLILSFVVFIPRFIVTFIDPNYFNNLTTFRPQQMWFFLIEVLGVFLFVVLLWRMYSVLVGRNDKLREDLKIAFTKIWLIIGAVLLQLIIFLITAAIIYCFYRLIFKDLSLLRSSYHAAIALVGVTIYLLIECYLIFLFIFYLLLIVIEDKGILSALKKSAKLVWGLWWRNFWILMTPLIFYMILLMIVRYLLFVDLPIYLIDSTPSSKLISIFYMFLFSLFIPWNAAIFIIQMRDLERRKKL